MPGMLQRSQCVVPVATVASRVVAPLNEVVVPVVSNVRAAIVPAVERVTTTNVLPHATTRALLIELT